MKLYIISASYIIRPGCLALSRRIRKVLNW